MPLTPKSLYERIGGSYTINAAVDSYYEKVLSDDRINFFFDGVSMDRQMGKLKLFLKVAFGGQTGYTEKRIREVHAPLVERGLNDAHVDIIIVHMTKTLEELGIAEDLIDEAIAVIDSHRDDVLNR